MAKMIDSKIKYKWYIYDLYKKIMPAVLDDYDSISRSKMIKQIIAYYNNEPRIMSYILNDEEIKIAFNNIGKELDHISFADTLIYSSNPKTFKYSLSEEIKYSFIEEYKEYLQHKKEIELEKETDYYTVGLFRRYGALSKKEYNDILKSVFGNNNYTHHLYSPYVKRFVKERFDETFGLIELDEDYDDILKTHPKKIKIDYTYDELIQMGKNVIIKNHRYNLLKDRLYKYMFDDLYLYAGCNNINDFISHNYNSICDLSDDLKMVLNNYFFEYPSFYLKDLRNDSLDSNGIKLYYKIFPKFMEYCGKKYNMKIEKYIDDSYNTNQMFAVCEKCLENKFDLVDKYVYRDNFSEEEKEFLLGLKKAVGGTFMIVKHTKNGSLMIGEENKLYCVKGIIDAIKDMRGLQKEPQMIKTILIPYKNSIIHCGAISSYTISIGPNITKKLKEEIKNKTIIYEL